MRSVSQIRAEAREVARSTDPLLRKISRGERLSASEQKALSAANIRLSELRDERWDAEDRAEAQGLSDAAAAGVWTGDGSSGRDDTPEARNFTAYLRTGAIAPEMRAAGEGAPGTAGGYLVPPGWWQRLQVALKAYGGTAADFQQLPTDTGQPMLWATTDPTTTVAVQIAEGAQVSDVYYVFGQGQLGAYMYTSGVQKVSFQLANDSAFDVDAFVQARVAESLGRKEAADAISGTGTNQPLGIITALNAASTSGSGGVFTTTTGVKVNMLGSTANGADQVAEGSAAGTLAPRTFLSVIKSVDPAYRGLGAKWYMNDVTLQNSRAIVNGFGDPFFKEAQGADPTIYGYPVVVDNNIPPLTATTSSGIIFGHLESAMVLRRVRDTGILRLEERYADLLQVGYIGYERVDMRSNDLRAAVVVKPAA
jgi:HK97 family phage major capsid protein